MNCMKHHRLTTALALTASLVAGVAAAAPPVRASISDANANAGTMSGRPMNASQRADAARQFVGRWATYVANTYGVDMGTWARRIGPVFGRADSDNIRVALVQDSFEGASLALDGRTLPTAAKASLQRLSSTSMSGPQRTKAAQTLLGSLGADLVYTPIQPCRIADTRTVAAGAIAANGSRNFYGFGVTNYSSQGGSSTDCGLGAVSPAALALNVTAVTPAAAGYATVFQYGTTQPGTASINYTAGAIVNNAIIAQTPNPSSSYDFTIYSFAQSHYVVDVVGYFAPPMATALQCTDTANSIVSVAAGATANAYAPACPSGYTATSTNCETGSWQMPLVFIHAGACSAQNNSSSAAELRSSRTCCRVPGR